MLEAPAPRGGLHRRFLRRHLSGAGRARSADAATRGAAGEHELRSD